MPLEIHYWGGNEALKFPGFTGRAEPAILLLEHAGVSYDFRRYDITAAKKPFQEYMGDSLYPSQACPVLTDGSFSVSQTPAIMDYLGRKHGYLPEGAEAQANCLQMALNAADMWAEGYKGRQAEDLGADFLDNRLDMWLQIIESSLGKHTGGPFCFGEKVTYCDFELFNTFRVLNYCYGEPVESRYAAYPLVQAFTAAILDLPAIKNYYDNVAHGKEGVLYPLVDAATRAKMLGKSRL